jgi:hypothetical protein
LRLAFALALLGLYSVPASAQYMFLDANGDGVYNADTDKLNSNGTPTTVDVYLVTNQNRDGTTAVCDVDGTSPLSINSYVINLEAAGGTVTYANFVNDMGVSFSTNFGELNAGDGGYKNGYGAQTPVQPGKYKLATITITGATGAPSINIVDQIATSSDYTSFGTGAGGCVGHDFDNTYKLTGPKGGTDWTDVDGLGPAPGGNAAPTLTVAQNITAVEGQLLTIEATATDPNPADVVTISETTTAPFLTNFTSIPGPSPVTATLAGTPAPGTSGVYLVTWVATDNVNPPDTVVTTVTVNPAGSNNCPVLSGIGDKTVTELTELSFTAVATDADAGQTVTFSLGDGAPVGASINATSGFFTWTPTDAQGPGTYAILVQATDNATQPCTDSETIQVTVLDQGAGTNQCPVLNPIGNQTVTEGNLLTFTATATDPDAGQTLTFSIDPGFPSGASINSSTGVFSWTPAADQGPATYPITVRVTDNGNPQCSDSEDIMVTVNDSTGGNLCPTLDAIGNKTVTEGNLLTFTAAATDPNTGQTLTFSLGGTVPTGASINSSTGMFTWTPTSDQGPGTYPITVKVTDSGEPACADSEIVTVTVNDSGGGQNQCPVLNAIGNKTVTEGQLLTFTATATDPDAGQTLTFSLDPGFPTGTSINSSTGVFTWTPTLDQGPGTYSVTVRVTDSADPSCSDFETITVTVNDSGQNQCPVLNAIGNQTVTEGNLLTFTATATDPDAGQTLTFSLDPGFPTGATINSSTGVFSFTPTSDQGPGTYTITVRVTDSANPSCSDSETITVTVNDSGGQNQCPVLNPIGNKSVTVNTMLTFTATASDPDAGQTLTFSLDPGAPAGASIGASTGIFTWTPTATGSFPITVRVTDSADPSCSDFETIVVTVGEGGGGNVTYNTFLTGGNQKTRLWTGKPSTCIQLEVVGAENSTIDLGSLVLVYNGQQISAMSADLSRDTDQDGNGEIEACFSKEDLRTLFDSLPTGDNQVTATLQGMTTTGQSFSAEVTMDVVVRGNEHARNGDHGKGQGGDKGGNGGNGGNVGNGGSGGDEDQGDDVADNDDSGQGQGNGGNGGNGHGHHASAKPNPLNPSTTLEFTVAKTGPVKVQVFNATGRLVKALYEGTMQEGRNTLGWDGTTSVGSHVASGVYYFRIVTSETREIVRVTVLK